MRPFRNTTYKHVRVHTRSGRRAVFTPRTNAEIARHDELSRREDRCEKRTYTTKHEARLALMRVRADRRRQGIEGDYESRVYHCPRCRLFHLTSEPKRDTG